MAIKIIKPGKKPETTKRFTCEHCGCVFEADEDSYRLNMDITEGTPYAYAICPTCGLKVYRLRYE